MIAKFIIMLIMLAMLIWLIAIAKMIYDVVLYTIKEYNRKQK